MKTYSESQSRLPGQATSTPPPLSRPALILLPLITVMALSGILLLLFVLDQMPTESTIEPEVQLPGVSAAVPAADA